MFDKAKNLGAHRWLTAYAPVIVWAFVVLGLGTGLGAMDETSRFIRPFLEWLLPNVLPETITSIHAVIRKFAHFAEYSILAVLAWNAFRRSSRPYLFAFLLTAAVAILDEFNQSFNPHRTSSPYDVFLDAASGALILLLIFRIAKHRRPGSV